MFLYYVDSYNYSRPHVMYYHMDQPKVIMGIFERGKKNTLLGQYTEYLLYK